MRNQILNAKELIDVQSINSGDDFGKIKETQEALLDGEVDVLIVSPERFANEYFQRIYFNYCKNNRPFCYRRGSLHINLGA